MKKRVKGLIGIIICMCLTFQFTNVRVLAESQQAEYMGSITPISNGDGISFSSGETYQINYYDEITDANVSAEDFNEEYGGSIDFQDMSNEYCLVKQEYTTIENINQYTFYVYSVPVMDHMFGSNDQDTSITLDPGKIIGTDSDSKFTISGDHVSDLGGRHLQDEEGYYYGCIETPTSQSDGFVDWTVECTKDSTADSPGAIWNFKIEENIRTYNMVLDYGDGNIVEEPYFYNKDYTLPTTMSDGTKLAGWADVAGATTPNVSNTWNYKPTEDDEAVTLYAIKEPEVVEPDVPEVATGSFQKTWGAGTTIPGFGGSFTIESDATVYNAASEYYVRQGGTYTITMQ